jgi:hypothetical protein
VIKLGVPLKIWQPVKLGVPLLIGLVIKLGVPLKIWQPVKVLAAGKAAETPVQALENGVLVRFRFRLLLALAFNTGLRRGIGMRSVYMEFQGFRAPEPFGAVLALVLLPVRVGEELVELQVLNSGELFLAQGTLWLGRLDGLRSCRLGIEPDVVRLPGMLLQQERALGLVVAEGALVRRPDFDVLNPSPKVSPELLDVRLGGGPVRLAVVAEHVVQVLELRAANGALDVVAANGDHPPAAGVDLNAGADFMKPFRRKLSDKTSKGQMLI